ncbi:hypothetical protein B0O79_1387 [Flavobacteriaceae bacterium MAR_2009_75]|nr:hypothetical protein B0O79_1387 [Flavobacteriaceae bacterium MAR_2009_75]
MLQSDIFYYFYHEDDSISLLFSTGEQIGFAN